MHRARRFSISSMMSGSGQGHPLEEFGDEKSVPSRMVRILVLARAERRHPRTELVALGHARCRLQQVEHAETDERRVRYELVAVIRRKPRFHRVDGRRLVHDGHGLHELRCEDDSSLDVSAHFYTQVLLDVLSESLERDREPIGTGSEVPKPVLPLSRWSRNVAGPDGSAGDDTVTDAPGSTPPVASRTVPKIVPVMTWAETAAVANRKPMEKTMTCRVRIPLEFFISPPCVSRTTTI